MRKILSLSLSLIILLTILYPTGSFGQKCAKKSYCSQEQEGDYDYRSQSHYSEMTSGETQRVEIVVYANQIYRLLVCTDPKVGNYEYKIFNVTKRPQRVVQDIFEKEVNVYKQAQNGEYEFDSNGDKILLGTTIVNDTVWLRKTVQEETIIFDSQSNPFKPPYWETQTTNTGMLVIEITLNESSEEKIGCVNILVGRKTPKTRNLSR
jgi:hypothetical protein